MRFLLITSLHKELVKVWVCQETSSAGSLLPPVDLASIASVLRQKRHDVKIVDLRCYKDPLKEYHKELESFEPEYIILNISTTSTNYDYELIANTPDNIKKICFGTHAQSMSHECFKRGVDYILIGDPEAAISNLLENDMDGISSNGILTVDTREKDPCYWEDLDSMPFPALDLLDLHRYHAPYIRHGNLFTLLLGSRGCNYSCTYCLYPVFFGNKSRLRSVGNIVAEIKDDYERYGIREFYFLDATFNIIKKRVEDFCNELLRSDLKVNWSCNMRVSPISIDMLRLMKKAGCNRIFYGVEDQDLLEDTRKKTTKELTIDAFQRTKEAGISTVAFMMLFPRQDVDEREYKRNMLSVIDMLKTDAFQCNIAIPFPGTEMYDKLVESGDICTDWKLYDPHGEKLPYRSNIDLLKIRKSIYRGFLLFHPIRSLKIATNLNFRSLRSAVMTFLKNNLMLSLL